MAKEKGRSERYRGSSEIQQSNFSEYSCFMGFNSGYFKRGNSLFINTLTEAAFRILKKVAQLPQIPEFYLAGGSAAALYLGHRVSIVLDFFTERRSYQSEPLIQSIQGLAIYTFNSKVREPWLGCWMKYRSAFSPIPMLYWE
jgi:hypothetical protein